MAVGFLLAFSAAAAAHGAEASVTIDPAMAQPGQTITVSIHGLEPGASCALHLASNGDAVPLGATDADAEGDLTITIRLPVALTAGVYRLEARSGDVTLSAGLVIDGQPILPEEDDGERDEEDPLLVPLPSGWGRGVTGAGPPAPSVGPVPGAGAADPATASAWLLWVALAIGLALLAGSLLVARAARARRR